MTYSRWITKERLVNGLGKCGGRVCKKQQSIVQNCWANPGRELFHHWALMEQGEKWLPELGGRQSMHYRERAT